MAEDGNIFGGGGRRNGWGGGSDRDTDRRPGGSAESREYARRFDPRSEGEFTNLLEVANRIEAARRQKELDDDIAESHDAARAARKHVHFFPTVGKFIIPPENTWAAHAQLVADDENRLAFNPEKYVYFDKIIAERFGQRALYDPKHRDYAKYEGLRTNLEVLRNDIIGIYLKDGGFDPGDEKYIPYIASIAETLGDALANDTWFKRPFTRSVSVDVAGKEGPGARAMYKHLLSVQERPGLMHNLRAAIYRSAGVPDRAWGLPPLEQTPYSDENLSAAPPKSAVSPAAGNESVSAQMAIVSEGLVGATHRLRTVEELTVPTRQESVEEARRILRWLRNLQFGEQNVEEWMDRGTPAEQLSKTEAVAKLVDIYSNQLRLGLAKNPGLMNELAIQDASEAAGALAQGVAEHAWSILPDGDPHLAALDALLAASPAQWEMRQSQSVERLLHALESGIAYASGRTVADRSPIERLVEISDRVQRNAYRLRSVDTLEPPTREESIELAREILRRLKNLSFSDKDLTEVVDTGRPQDKAELAEKIDEMVDIYKNLIAEAVQANPNIAGDAQVHEAATAAGVFTHTVKLMAAKEIPSSVAAAQQISADITRMPEEWKQLHGHTVDRLVASMEGGLEKAVGELASQQAEQQQQQDEELAQQQAEAALIASHGRRRRRRRRQSGGGHSLTKSAKRRNAGDLNGDGVLDKFQGLNLKGTDLAAIKELGGNLRAMGDQATHLTPPIIDISAMEKLAPDDRTFVVRDQDQKKTPGHRPKDHGI